MIINQFAIRKPAEKLPIRPRLSKVIRIETLCRGFVGSSLHLIVCPASHPQEGHGHQSIRNSQFGPFELRGVSLRGPIFSLSRSLQNRKVADQSKLKETLITCHLSLCWYHSIQPVLHFFSPVNRLSFPIVPLLFPSFLQYPLLSESNHTTLLPSCLALSFSLSLSCAFPVCLSLLQRWSKIPTFSLTCEKWKHHFIIQS